MVFIVTPASPGWPIWPMSVRPGMKPPAPTIRNTMPKIIAKVRVFMNRLPTVFIIVRRTGPRRGSVHQERSRNQFVCCLLLKGLGSVLARRDALLHGGGQGGAAVRRVAEIEVRLDQLELDEQRRAARAPDEVDAGVEERPAGRGEDALRRLALVGGGRAGAD